MSPNESHWVHYMTIVKKAMLKLQLPEPDVSLGIV